MAVKNGLVVELGEHFVRMWSPPKNTKHSKTMYSDEQSFMFLTPEGAVVDGQITAPEALAVTLTEQMARNGLRKVQNVTFSIPSSRVAMREVILPPIKEARVKDIVATNASDYFPVDLSTYHIAHSILGPVSDTDNRLRVMVYAVPMAIIGGYFELAAAAGLRIASIDYAGNSQFNVYKEFDIPGVNLFVFINHGTSYLTFLSGKNLIFQRALTFGGGALIEEYQTADPARDYLEVYNLLSDPSREDEVLSVLPEDEVLQALSRLGAGIARSIDSFTSNYVTEAVDNIILIGPMGRLLRLKEAVESATGHETRYLDEVHEAVTTLSTPAKALPYLDCVGALIAPLDLMPARFVKSKSKQEKRKRQSVALGVTVFILMLLAAAALSAYGYLNLTAATLTNDVLRSDVAATEYAEEIYGKYRAYAIGANAIVQVRHDTESPIDNIVSFLSELEVKMPSEILVLSATCADDTITMNMTVSKKSDVARVMTQFRTFDSLLSLSVPAIMEASDSAGVDTVSFTITCLYNPLPKVLPAPEFAPQETVAGDIMPSGDADDLFGEGGI